jgi:uncharacterized membrane protein YdcZ (DUF606 family)
MENFFDLPNNLPVFWKYPYNFLYPINIFTYAKNSFKFYKIRSAISSDKIRQKYLRSENMKNMVILGAVSALSTGVLIGIQSFFSGRGGAEVGPFSTGLWTNFLGGAVAGILILLVISFFGSAKIKIPQSIFVLTLISGALGILIIMGIAFAISKAGVAAGLAGTIFGQFLFGMIADSFGWGGTTPIPLDSRRFIGLAFMAISVFLLLPKE